MWVFCLFFCFSKGSIRELCFLLFSVFGYIEILKVLDVLFFGLQTSPLEILKLIVIDCRVASRWKLHLRLQSSEPTKTLPHKDP